jgi:hypothetical protein
MKISIMDLIRVQILKKQPNSVYADADIESINIGNGLDFDDDLLNVPLESFWNEISTDVRKKVSVVLDAEAPTVKEEVINIDDSPTVRRSGGTCRRVDSANNGEDDVSEGDDDLNEDAAIGNQNENKTEEEADFGVGGGQDNFGDQGTKIGFGLSNNNPHVADDI